MTIPDIDLDEPLWDELECTIKRTIQPSTLGSYEKAPMCAWSAVTVGHRRSSVESRAWCVHTALIRARGGQTQHWTAFSIYMVRGSAMRRRRRTLRLQGVFQCLRLSDYIFWMRQMIHVNQNYLSAFNPEDFLSLRIREQSFANSLIKLQIADLFDLNITCKTPRTKHHSFII